MKKSMKAFVIHFLYQMIKQLGKYALDITFQSFIGIFLLNQSQNMLLSSNQGKSEFCQWLCYHI